MKIIRTFGRGWLHAAMVVVFLLACGRRHSDRPAPVDSVMNAMPGRNKVAGKPARRLKPVSIDLDGLLRPANGFVLSSVAVTTMRPDTVRPQLKVFGTIGYDTRLINTISARVAGRIEKLYVRYRYQHVRRGDPIMDIYSPQLQTAGQEYLFVLKNDSENTTLTSAARQRLILLGVDQRQIDKMVRTGTPLPTLTVYSSYTGHIHDAGNTMPPGNAGIGAAAMAAGLSIKEGMYVEKGQTVFQVFNMDRSWALLNLFPGQEALVSKGDPVEVVPETAPDKSFRGRVDLVEPIYREGQRSPTVRVYFDNDQRDIAIGSAVRATIYTATVVGNWLPTDAVLSLGSHRVVFLRKDNGFRAHEVRTGMTNGNAVRILSGLTAHDSVAANADFLVDSEDFIKTNQEP